MLIKDNYISKKELTQAVFSNFTKSEERIFDYLSRSCYQLRYINYSYETIARILGVCRNTIKRSVIKFRKLGLITTSKFVRRKSYSIMVNPDLYKYAYEFKNAFVSLKHIAFQNYFSVTNRNEPLYKKIINNNLLYMKDYLCTGAKKVINFSKETLTRVVKTTNGRKQMQEVEKIVISPTLKDVSSRLNVTLVGQLKLLSFSDKVLVQAWSKVKYMNKIHDQYNFLVKTCVEICTQQGSKPDWSLFYLLLKRYNCVDNKRYVMVQDKQEPTRKIVITTVQQPTPSFVDRVPEYKKLMQKYNITQAHPMFAQETQEFLRNNDL